ncbi:hypothetical protein D3C72_955320 [compost metagenome]
MLGEFDRQVITHHAQRERIQGEHRQAGPDLHLGHRQAEFNTENRPAQQYTGELREGAEHEQTLAAGGDVVHGHHRQDGHGGQRVELKARRPETAEHRVV